MCPQAPVLGVADAESCKSCPALPLPAHHLAAQGGAGPWPVTSPSLPSGLDHFFLILLGVSAVLRPEPAGCGVRPPAQERPLGRCA